MSTNPPSTAANSAESIHDARLRRTILIAVCVALMAVTASVTGLNVARPELAGQFGASQSEVLWFITLYTISLAALLLPLGALGDTWGRKPMLVIGPQAQPLVRAAQQSFDDGWQNAMWTGADPDVPAVTTD